jgi:thiol-disulfide isomerase/thioredoxin
MLYRLLILLLSFSVWCVDAAANPGTVNISGTVAETANVEVSIVKTVNNRSWVAAEYVITPTSRRYVFSLPVEAGASYKLLVNVMKQGSRRLEVDKKFSFPLQLRDGQDIAVNITPSLLDTTGRKGITIYAQKNQDGISIVSGTLVNSKFGGPIELQKVVNGKLERIAGFNVPKTGQGFRLPAVVEREGFYYVTTLRWRVRVYLKPGEDLHLDVDALSGRFTLVNGSAENRMLEKWQQLAWPIIEYGYFRNVFQADSLSLQDYINTYEQLQPAIAAFKSSNQVGNERFNNLLDLAVDLDNAYAPLYLWSCFSRKNRTAAGPPAFYRNFLNADQFSHAGLLYIGETMSFLNLYGKMRLANVPGGKELFPAQQLNVMMDGISNDTLKSLFLKDQIETLPVNNLREFRATFQPFEKYATDPEVKKKYQQLYGSFIGDTAWLGKSSYNFSLPDSSGRMVSMKDFKGKVIFIDVWATWCGPCKEQFPHLKELEEEYRNNKNIVFMGISLDRAKDKQKWANLIQKQKLPGVQLLDDMGSAFGRKYGITSIPRFLLIDKQGNWKEVRCPRPESKKQLKKYLDEALRG